MAITVSNRSIYPVFILDRRFLNAPALAVTGYVVLTVITYSTDWAILRVGLALVLAILGPGSATVTVLYPRPKSLDFGEYAALSACLSITVGGLLGFALARSHWGLHFESFLITTALYSSICGALTWYQRRNLDDEERFLQLDCGKQFSRWTTEPVAWRRWITVALITALLSGAWMFFRDLGTPTADPSMTEFFILGKGGLTQDYLRAGRPGESLQVDSVIVNGEQEAAVYRIQVFIDGQEVGGTQPVTMERSSERMETIQFQIPPTVSGFKKVEFVLYRGAQPYRFLHLWINIGE